MRKVLIHEQTPTKIIYNGIEYKSLGEFARKYKFYSSEKKKLLQKFIWKHFGFFRTNIFLNQVYNNYLTWNGPFWLDLDSKSILNVKNVDFNFFKYRVFEENYINNDLGKLCVINGEIRVVTRLLNYYYIPFYKAQFYMYRLFNKMYYYSINIFTKFYGCFICKRLKSICFYFF